MNALMSLPPTSIPQIVILTFLVIVVSPLILLSTVTFLLATIASLRTQSTAKTPTSTTSCTSSKLTDTTSSIHTAANISDSNNNYNNRKSFWSNIQTSLYSGRVSHIRFVPAVHHFSYPLFFCFLDLEEVPLLFGGEDVESKVDDGVGVGRRRERPALWPLTYLMNFRSGDHLKNGEGLLIGDDGDGAGDGMKDENNNSLSARIRRLISERTNEICSPSSDQKIFLLTHLCYFGYCFNPVSFYYLLKKERNADGSTAIEAIVAEVSNTPWNEMKCYVLHPNSRDIDIVQVIDGTGLSKKRAPSSSSSSSSHNGIPSPSRHATTEHDEDKISTTTTTTTTEEDYNAASFGSTTTTTATGKDDIRIDHNNINNSNSNSSINYIFNKTFHVSPFMELDYIYDWTFWNPTKSRIRVSANMIKKQTKADDNDNDDRTISNTTPNNIHHKNNKKQKHFNAYFDIHRQNFTPLHLGYQLFRLPVYCFIIQVWIHVEAFRLLLKGVVFIPHPEGAETMVSKVIAKVMAPVFELIDWVSGGSGGDGGSGDTLVEKDEMKCGDDKSQ